MSNNLQENMEVLLAKYFANETSQEEEQQVHTWMEDNDENLQVFEGYMHAWNNTGKLDQLISVDEDKAWQNFRAGYIDKPVVPMRKAPGSVSWMKVAAAIVIVLIGSWMGYRMFAGKEPAPLLLSLQAGAVAQTDTLPDKSVVTLNKNATVVYTEEKAAQRSVKLSGEAFFDVAPDKQKPFVITAGAAEIKVVGTSFNVKTAGANAEVIVKTGIVAVSYKGETITLQAGEKITVDTAGLDLKKEKQEDLLYNYYVSKTFICDNTPLWKLVDKLNEAYGSEIRIQNKTLASLPINVSFNEESLDRILDILQQTLMITVTKENNTILIK